MHRMRRALTQAGLTFALFAAAASGPGPEARAALIRPGASQSFPDLSGDIVGTQTYVYDPGTQTGTFQVDNTPTVLAIGPQASSEYYVNDPSGQPRSQTLQIKLDSGGRLVSDPGNAYALYGSVTINGQTLSGLLLKGTPTAFGFAPPDPNAPTMGVYDLNMNVTGGLLQQAYGSTAYMRIIAETNSTFGGSFAQSFLGLKAMTNVRSYDSPNPSPVPEPPALAVLAACAAAGLVFRRRVAARDLGRR